ncbi:hypothetical protein ACFL6D_04560 [Spirochaetota bacterium]
MYRIKWIVLVPVFIISAVTSCAHYKIHKESLGTVKKVGILTMKINKMCTGKVDKTKYIDIIFIGKYFRGAFIEKYNSLDAGLKFSSFSNAVLLESNDSIQQGIIYDTGHIYFKDNLDNEKLSPDAIKALMSSHGYDAYAVFDLRASVWAQQAKGDVTIYNADGSIVWQQEIKEAVSTYIIKDPNSPYVSEYEILFDQLDEKPSHKSELIKMFNEVAENMALEMKEARHKALKLDPKKEKVKLPKKKYR